MKLRNLATAAAVVFALAATQGTALADQEIIYIDGTFPDQNFRALINEYDTDSDGYLSSDEIAEITEINAKELNIKSVKGVEYLTNLEIFRCSDNELSTIDVSHNTKLKKLYVANNDLSTIDVSMLKDLTLLRVNGNNLTSLDLSKNTKLERVFTENNEIDTLDFSHNPKVIELIETGHFYYWKDNKDDSLSHYCFVNQTEDAYPLSYSPSTTIVGYEDIYPSMTTNIDSKSFPDQAFRDYILTNVDKDHDNYLSVEESKSVRLMDLNRMGITSLKGIERFPTLLTLYCSYNEIDELDLKMNTHIGKLECADNGMDKLTFAWNCKLLFLDCSYNYLRELDLTNPRSLNKLNCSSNYLTTLDVTDNKVLSTIVATDNGLNEIIYHKSNRPNADYTYDANRFIPAPYTATKISKLFPDAEFQRYVSDNIDKNEDGILTAREMRAIKVIKIPDKGIKSLKGVEIFENLEHLDCAGCNLGELDVSKSPILTLKCDNCHLTSLKVSDRILNVVCNDNELTEAPFGKLTYLLVCNNNKIKSITISQKDELYQALQGNVTRKAEYMEFDYEGNYQLIVDGFVTIEAAGYDGSNIPTATPTPTSAVTATPTAAAKPTSKPTSKPTAGPAPATATPIPIDKSTESGSNIVKFVTRLYTEVLGRDAEEDGVNFWSDELYNFRRSGAEVGLQFVFSEEFINRKTTDDQFVTILYKTFFNRELEEEGFKFWTSALADGSMDRMTVATGFIYSQEWADTCATYGIRSGCDAVTANVQIEPTELTYAFVERMYTTAMNRASDAEGLEYWAHELSNFKISGEVVGASFFLSDEMNGFKLSDSEYVTRLYKTFMDREPDEDGLSYWVGLLGSGSARADVVFGFTRSPEFTGKCVEARILPY